MVVEFSHPESYYCARLYVCVHYSRFVIALTHHPIGSVALGKLEVFFFLLSDENEVITKWAKIAWKKKTQLVENTFRAVYFHAHEWTELAVTGCVEVRSGFSQFSRSGDGGVIRTPVNFLMVIATVCELHICEYFFMFSLIHIS